MKGEETKVLKISTLFATHFLKKKKHGYTEKN
jgi:hypothetical protein